MSANPWAKEGPNADLHWQRECLVLKAENIRLREALYRACVEVDVPEGVVLNHEEDGFGTDAPEDAIWSCKIGWATRSDLPEAADGPLRQAVEEAYRRLTGEEPRFCFSGWGDELTEAEQAALIDGTEEPAGSTSRGSTVRACESAQRVTASDDRMSEPGAVEGQTEHSDGSP